MAFFYPKFFIKTALYGLVPGGFGYYRYLRQYRDEQYNHERDKHPVRDRHNRTSGWKDRTSMFRQREYQNYDEYRTHQAQKYHEILKARGGFPNYTVVAWRQKFFRRFRSLPNYLLPEANIICLGARQGTEVEVLRDLGFKNAYGIDLNPGPDNPYVRPGDFMKVDADSASVDLIYTNSVDHAFDLDAFIQEHVRLLKVNGYALYDLPRYSSRHEPGAFESIGWNDPNTIFAKIKDYFADTVLSRSDARWQWTLFHKPRKKVAPLSPSAPAL